MGGNFYCMITEIFGENCKRAKVIDVLLSHPNSEYTKSDISKIANIHRTTLNTFIDDLIEFRLIEVTRSLGNAKFYKINLNSSITQALNSLKNQLSGIEIKKQDNIFDKTSYKGIKIKRLFKEITRNNCFDIMVSTNPTNTNSVLKFNQSLHNSGKLTSVDSITGDLGITTYDNVTSQPNRVKNSLFY